MSNPNKSDTPDQRSLEQSISAYLAEQPQLNAEFVAAIRARLEKLSQTNEVEVTEPCFNFVHTPARFGGAFEALNNLPL